MSPLIVALGPLLAASVVHGTAVGTSVQPVVLSIESPYRRVKDGRVTDFAIVTNAGGTRFKVGDVVELAEVTEENTASRTRKNSLLGSRASNES